MISLKKHRKEFLVGLAIAIFSLIGNCVKELFIKDIKNMFGYFAATIILFLIWIYVANGK